MSNYSNAAAIVRDEDHILYLQTEAAVARAALDILSESTGTPRHEARVKWAQKVFRTGDGPRIEAGKFIWRVLANNTIRNDPLNATDANVQAQVDAVVNDYIGLVR